MKHAGATRPGEDARGFALIVVVWFLVLIGTIGTYLLVNARAETAIARNVRAAASAEALADAGIARIVLNQIDPSLSDRWKLDGGAHLLSLSSGEISIRLADETQKINPNLASENLLTALLEVRGVEQGAARRLGAAIADWVGPDGPPRPLGAKLEQYRAAGRNYGPANAPVENLDELALVLGMTPAILASVRPYLTIHTQSGQPNIRNAPQVIRRAVAIAALLEKDEDAEAEAPNAPAAKPAVAEEPERLIAAQITARGREGGVFVRYAVLRLDPENPKGYAVLDWQRGVLDDAGNASGD